MYKLTFFIPETHKEIVKTSLFEIGAGNYKNYDCCSFETLGRGQFRPLKDANPYIGKKGKVKIVDEYKIEMIVMKDLIKKVVDKLKEVHPYEEPAFDVIKLEKQYF